MLSPNRSIIFGADKMKNRLQGERTNQSSSRGNQYILSGFLVNASPHISATYQSLHVASTLTTKKWNILDITDEFLPL